MKKVLFLITIVNLGFTGLSQAQFTQVELFSGLQKTDISLYSSYPLIENQKLSLNTLAFFQKFSESENQAFNETGLQPTVFWNFNSHFALGPSLYYNSIAGYSQRLSAKFQYQKSRLVLVLIPSLAYSKQSSAYAEAFAQFQYQKPLNKKISLWLNGQLLSVWNDLNNHARSFQQWRAGLSIKGHQFGLGLDWDHYGPLFIERQSYGLYYRKTF